MKVLIHSSCWGLDMRLWSAACWPTKRRLWHIILFVQNQMHCTLINTQHQKMVSFLGCQQYTMIRYYLVQIFKYVINDIDMRQPQIKPSSANARKKESACLHWAFLEFRSNKQNNVIPTAIKQDSIYKSQLRNFSTLYIPISSITRMLHYQNQEKCIIVFHGWGI